MTQLPELFRLNGRVALVTGGAGLLGAEFCRTLAEAGAAVLVSDLNVENAQNVAARITQSGFSARAVRTDVTDADSVQESVDYALSEFGRLDILVNSAALDPKVRKQEAGIGDQEAPNALITNPLSPAFENYPLELWKQALDVNLTGLFLTCQAAVKPMLAQGSGVIINIASMYGLVPPDQRLYQRAGQPPAYKPAYYTVTKAGVIGLTKYLAAYYAGKDIRVNTLTPGGVFNDHDDEFTQKYAARSIQGRMAQKDEMNGALLFLASDASSHMTGGNLIVDGGWTTW